MPLETLSFAGLDVTIARQQLARSENWESVMAPGIWCGVLADGRIDTEGNGGRRNWGPSTLINYRVDAPSTINHSAPLACTLEAVFVRVRPEDVQDVLGSTGLVETSPFRVWHNQRLATSLARQMLSCPLFGAARRLYLSGKALEILAEVTSSEPNESASARRDFLPVRNSERERVHEALKLIADALSDPPSVPELGRMVGLNAHRLGQLFRAEFGCSVYAYIKGARLDHAKRLLESEEISVAQAAYRSGYHPAHFSTEFRKRFGFAPNLIGRNGRFRSSDGHS